jgi:4-amino-4-deoxy-L-arabinose transferase-like glycosyltransferase
MSCPELEELKRGKEKGVKEWKGKEEWVLGGFILASGLVLFLNLWGRSFENHGYLRYAEVAREMIRSGDWIVLHYNGEIYINKPPLLFWLIAIPSTLAGSVTPLTARLPSFFSAWVGVIVTCLWARKVYGTLLSGLISGGALLSAYQYFFQARLAKTDILLCVFILLSLYFFYLGYREPRWRRFLYHGLSFGFIGLGNLTKGPFGMLPLFIIAIFLIKEREVKRLISKEFLVGYLILALTSLPWVFLFIHRVGWEQAITLMKENKILSRQAPVYFYFLEIWAQFLPWSLLFPLMGFYVWRERKRIWHSHESLFLIWVILLFVLLTLIKVRASRYLLPLLPPIALILGGMWGGMWGGVWGEKLKKKRSLFLIPFLLSLLVWHSIEIYRIRNNVTFSPGMVLAGELKPLVKNEILIGYRLDLGAIEEINFYLDRVILTLEKISDLSDQFRGKEKRWVLMPKVTYDKIRLQSGLPMVFVREFPYKDKKGRRLVLVSN